MCPVCGDMRKFTRRRGILAKATWPTCRTCELLRDAHIGRVAIHVNRQRHLSRQQVGRNCPYNSAQSHIRQRNCDNRVVRRLEVTFNALERAHPGYGRRRGSVASDGRCCSRIRHGPRMPVPSAMDRRPRRGARTRMPLPCAAERGRRRQPQTPVPSAVDAGADHSGWRMPGDTHPIWGLMS